MRYKRENVFWHTNLDHLNANYDMIIQFDVKKLSLFDETLKLLLDAIVLRPD